MNETEKKLAALYEERGETLLEGKDSVSFEVDLKSERVTVRLSVDEAKALDKACRRLRTRRSAFIRAALRRALGLPGNEEAAALGG